MFLAEDDAIQRCFAFRDAGRKMTFPKVPQTVEQIGKYYKRVSGWKLANMLEHGSTPILPPGELQEMGYTMAAYPLTLLLASVRSMQRAVWLIRERKPTDNKILPFAETKSVVGFNGHAEEEERYRR